jgi:predicted nuclease of predicted toxin-antitoxin system
LSLKLLIDEDTQYKALVNTLRASSHDILTVNEAGLSGQKDALILDFAIHNNRVLLTRNCKDFEILHQEMIAHPGILGIYQDRNYSKDMSIKDIVKAIANLETSGCLLVNQFIALNHWSY